MSARRALRVAKAAGTVLVVVIGIAACVLMLILTFAPGQ